MENKNLMTKEGLTDLKKEMKNLIEVERPKVIQDIKDARALGDLSENAEFDAAREKQGQIEDRIKEIENIIENTTIIAKSEKAHKITRIGSVVTFKDLSKNTENTVTIVGSLEADPFEMKISNSSPLGEALLNSKVGDKNTVQLSNKYEIEIIKIEN